MIKSRWTPQALADIQTAKHQEKVEGWVKQVDIIIRAAAGDGERCTRVGLSEEQYRELMPIYAEAGFEVGDLKMGEVVIRWGAK